MNPQGRYYINGKDLWLLFSVLIESGTDDFLKIPSTKEPITRDWSDAHGIDVDLANKFFNPRTINLRCAIIVNSESEFWEKYNAFIAEWMQPGLGRFQVTEHGLRSYYCFYKESGSFDRFTRIKIDETGDVKVACKFSLQLTEVEPKIDNLDTFIWDEQGRFLIT